jgi:hypothetical protein
MMYLAVITWEANSGTEDNDRRLCIVNIEKLKHHLSKKAMSALCNRKVGRILPNTTRRTDIHQHFPSILGDLSTFIWLKDVAEGPKPWASKQRACSFSFNTP